MMAANGFASSIGLMRSDGRCNSKDETGKPEQMQDLSRLNEMSPELLMSLGRFGLPTCQFLV